MASQKIVGIILLNKCENQQSFTDQFDIEQYLDIKALPIQDKFSIVRHLIFNPLFQCQVRYCLSEVMRQTSLFGLIYCRDTPLDEDPVSMRLAVRDFVPVRCRRM